MNNELTLRIVNNVLLSHIKSKFFVPFNGGFIVCFDIKDDFLGTPGYEVFNSRAHERVAETPPAVRVRNAHHVHLTK